MDPENLDIDLGGDLPGEDVGGVAPEAAAAAEEWRGPAREEWEQLTSFQQQLIPFLQEVEQRVFRQAEQEQPDPSSQLPPFDPFDPESVQAHVQAMAEQMFAERFGPIEPVINAMASQASAKVAEDHLDMLEKGDPERGIPGIGPFDREQAVLIATGLIDPSNPNFDAPAALRHAAQRVQAFESKIRADERAKYEERLRTMREAPTTPALGGGTGEHIPTAPDVRGMGAEKYELAMRGAMGRPTIVTG